MTPHIIITHAYGLAWRLTLRLFLVDLLVWLAVRWLAFPPVLEYALHKFALACVLQEQIEAAPRRVI